MTEPSWGALNRPPPGKPEPTKLDVICARLLTTQDGQELLKELRRRHFETASNAMADERALRVRAANQQFVLDLEHARDRGLAAMSTKKQV